MNVLPAEENTAGDRVKFNERCSAPYGRRVSLEELGTREVGMGGTRGSIVDRSCRALLKM